MHDTDVKTNMKFKNSILLGPTAMDHFLTLSQGCQNWDFIPRPWEFFKVMGFFLGFMFPEKTLGKVLRNLETFL